MLEKIYTQLDLIDFSHSICVSLSIYIFSYTLKTKHTPIFSLLDGVPHSLYYVSGL